MPASLKESRLDFSKALLGAYANLAVLQVRLYNDEDQVVRPSFKEMVYLYTIWKYDNCTASDLVEIFNSSKALISQTVISMEKKGFISRKKDPSDNRRQIITVSEEIMGTYAMELQLIDEALKYKSKQYSIEEVLQAARIVLDITDTMLRIKNENKQF